MNIRRKKPHRADGAFALTPIAKHVRNALLPASLALSLHVTPVLAGPQGGQVVAGQGSISNPNATTTVINQQSHNLGLNWQGFNVNANELVQFNQPSSRASALNNIFDQNPSQILGRINANGRVLLMNPNGVLFGPNAQVNVNALVAAGARVDVQDFMAGNFRLQSLADGDGIVVNQGLLEAASGGSITLAGKAVRNEGVILASSGRVNLLAGQTITVDFDGDGLMQFAVDEAVVENAQSLGSAVSNAGVIEASNVLLSASAAETVFDRSINNSGVIRAQQIDTSGGQIRLVGLGPDSSVINTGTLDASGSNGGSVAVTAGDLANLGAIQADGVDGDGGSVQLLAADENQVGGASGISARAVNGNGGSIQVLGETVTLTDTAVLDASGDSGGGEILVGGDFRGANGAIQNATTTTVTAGVSLAADALAEGDGGKVIVWADDTTVFHGNITGRGGASGGDGGLAEVSGHEHLLISGHANMSATVGTPGVLWLDPGSVAVVNGPNTAAGAMMDSFNDAWIEDQLDGIPNTDVTIETQNSLNGGTETITFANDVSIVWNTANTLTLIAGVDIILGGVVNGSTAGTIDFQFGQDNVSGILDFSATTAITASTMTATGAAGADTIIAPNLPNLWATTGINDGTLTNSNGTLTFSNVGALTGGTMVDTFNLGHNVTGMGVNAGDGNDQINLTASGLLFGALDGGNDSDTLQGPDASNTWTIVGTLDIDGQAFTNIENLTGGNTDDAFVFNGGAVSGTVNGGAAGGTNTLDYSALAGPIAVNLQTSSASQTGGIANINDLIGSMSGVDTLTGANAANAWNTTGMDAGNIGGAGVFDFASIENLSGGSLVDTFNLGHDITGTVDAGAGNDQLTLTAGGLTFGSLDGGADTDTLQGPDATNTWNIDGGPDIDGQTFTNVENLTGGNTDDAFVFNGGAVSGTVNGGAAGGTNTLDYSALAGPIAVNLQTSSASQTGGIANINDLIGSMSGVDTLTGANAANAWNTTGMDAGNIGGAGVFDFASIENLSGGSLVDTFNLGHDITGTVDAGAGNDQLTLTAGGLTFGSLDGGADTDTLQGPDATNTWNIDGGPDIDGQTFTNVENLTGGNTDDAFVFNGGAVSGTVNGGAAGGTNTLDYSALAGPIAVNLQTPTASQTGGIANINDLIGSMSGADTLTGANAANMWNTTGMDAGNIGGAGVFDFASIENLSGGSLVDTFNLGHDITGTVDAGAGNDQLNLTAGGLTFGSLDGGADTDTLQGPDATNTWNIDGGPDIDGQTFTNVENLTGGNTDDAFVFNGGAVSGTVNGGAAGGTNTLDYSALAGPIAVNLQTPSASQTGGIANINNLIGSMSGTDTLTGADAANTWNIDAADEGDIGGAFDFTSIENVTGGSMGDGFLFTGAGALTGTVDGGAGGTNTLDYSALAGPIAVDLETPSASQTGGIANINDLIGSMSGVDTLTGANAANAWATTGMDAGNIGGAGVFDFAGIENLSGGTLVDTFALGHDITGTVNAGDGNDQITLTAGGLTFGTLDGGNNSDTLQGPDASNTWTIAGTLDIDGQTFTNIENLTGGNSDDAFVFNGGAVSGTVNGGAAGGTNTLDYSALAGPIAVNLQAATASQTGGIANINDLIGSMSGVDTLTGANAANAWATTGVDAGNIGGAGVFDFAGIENLTGGTLVDTFDLGHDITGTVNAGDGSDQITLTAGGLTFGTLDGGNNSDTLQGPDASNTWTIAGTLDIDGQTFTNIENLTGGNTGDAFVFNGGAVSGTVNGGAAGGTNTLDYSALAGPISVDLSAASAAQTGGIANINDLIGSMSNADTLIGNSGGDIWNTTGVNTGNVGGAGVFDFVSIENYTGGGGGDNFNLNHNVVGGVSGGNGADNFNLGAGVTVGTGIAGNGGTDTLAGPNVANVFTVTADGVGNIDTGALVSFSGVEILTGNAMTDTFIVTGVHTGTLNGGAANDLFDFDGTGAVTGSVNGGAGGFDQADFTGRTNAVNVILGTVFTLVEDFAGNGAQSTFSGDGGMNNFVTAPGDAGIVDGAFTYSGFHNLDGGGGDDTFDLNHDVSGTVNGGAGNDTVNFATSGVTIIGGVSGGLNDDTFNIDPADTGAIGFVINADLSGDVGSDSFNFGAGGAGGSNATLAGVIDGGMGIDTLDYSGSALRELVANIGSGPDGVSGTFAGVGGDADLVMAPADPDFINLNVIADNGLGTLIGPNEDTNWVISGLDSGTFQGASDPGPVGFSNFQIVGLGSADTFTFLNAGQITLGIDAGAGNNTVVGAPAGSIITLTGAGAFAGTVMGSIDPDGLGGTAATNLDNIVNLAGGAGDDTFTLAGVPVSGTIDGGGQATAAGDSLDLSGFAARTVLLTNSDGQGFDGTDLSATNSVMGGFTNIDTLVGTPFIDTVTGQDQNATWDIASVNYTVAGNTLDIQNFENLNGGSMADVFNVMVNHTGNLLGGAGDDSFVLTAAAIVTGTINGGLGTGDSLDFSGYAGTPRNIVIAGPGTLGALNGFQGADTGAPSSVTAGYDNINAVQGAAGDILTAPNTPNLWVITGVNTFTLNGGTIPFTGFTGLVGGTSIDVFKFDGGSQMATGVSGGPGAGVNSIVLSDNGDTLDITGPRAGNLTIGAATTAFINMDNVTNTATVNTVTVTGGAGVDTININTSFAGSLHAGDGDDTFNALNAANFGAAIGGAGNDTLMASGPFAAANMFVITGADIGTFNGQQFFGVENLTGTSAGLGADAFIFAGGTLSGDIDAGTAGFDLLTGGNGATTWDLMGATNTLTGLGGVFSGIDQIQGGSGADTFNVNATASFVSILGGVGDDIFNLTPGAVISGALDGQGGTNTLVGSDSVSVWNVTAVNAGNVTIGAGPLVNFANMQNLTGAATAMDTFAINAPLAGNLNMGDGANTVTATAPIGGAVSGGAGTDNITVGPVTGSINAGAGTNNITANGAVGGNIVTGNGVDTINVNNTVAGSIVTGAGNDAVTFAGAGNVAGIVNVGAGVDTVNYSLAAPVFNVVVGFNLVGAETASGGGGDTLAGPNAPNLWNITGLNTGTLVGGGESVAWTNFPNLISGPDADTFVAPTSFGGNVQINGNDVWTHTDGVALWAQIVGPLGSTLTVAGTPGADLAIETAGLNLPAMAGFDGHLIVGGTLTPPTLPLTGATATVINADTLSVNEQFVTGGDVTLLASNVVLAANIGAGGPGGIIGGPGGGSFTVIAVGDATSTADPSVGSPDGDISAPVPIIIAAADVTFIAANALQDSDNIDLQLRGGELQVALGATADEPTFDPNSNAVGVDLTADATAFVAALNINAQGVLVTFSNPGAQLTQLAELIFVDLGVFEQELEILGQIGTGIAMDLEQCEDLDGCAPFSSEEELDERIVQIEARIAELERRLEQGVEDRERAAQLLAGYRAQLQRFAEFKQQLQQYFSEEDEFGDDFDDFDDEFQDDAPGEPEASLVTPLVNLAMNDLRVGVPAVGGGVLWTIESVLPSRFRRY